MNFVLARKKSYFSWLVSTGMRQFCNKLWMEIYNCERPKYKASVAYLTRYLSDHWLIFVICFAGSHDSSKHLQQLTTTLVRWSQCPGPVTWDHDCGGSCCWPPHCMVWGCSNSAGSLWTECWGGVRELCPAFQWQCPSLYRSDQTNDVMKTSSESAPDQIVVSQQPSPQHSTATTLPPLVEMNESDFDKSEIAKCWSWVWVSQWSSVSNYLW